MLIATSTKKYLYLLISIFIPTPPRLLLLQQTKIRRPSYFSVLSLFLPKYFISTGIVTIPTIIRVDINTAICIKPAPLFNKAEASGKATNPGIKVIEPIRDAINIPSHPDFCPINPEIISGLNTASIIPIITRIDKN